MMTTKIIAVTGATGAQGGGLIRAILAHPEGDFTARAVTRKPDSQAARQLSARGVEVVKADLDDAASLAVAFAGAYGLFCVTNFWEHFSPAKEIAQAANLARAAKTAGASHVIWSTLEDVRKWVPLGDDRMPTLMDRYKVPHFDAKGESDHFFTDAGVPTTFLKASFYWDNFIHFGMGPKPGEDGTLAITLPVADAKLAGIAASDIGVCAYGIFEAGAKLIGKTAGIAGGHLTGNDMAASLSKALGKEVRYSAVSPAAYRAFGFLGAEELGNMFQVNAEFPDEYLRTRDIPATRRLNPGLNSFDSWLQANASKIPLS